MWDVCKICELRDSNLIVVCLYLKVVEYLLKVCWFEKSIGVMFLY